MSQAPYKSDKLGVQEFYVEGFESGMKWGIWNHLPGGPHVVDGRYDRDPDWSEFCKRTLRRHHAWKWGWRHGALHIGFDHARSLNPGTLTRDEVDAIILHVVETQNPHMADVMLTYLPALLV